MQLLAGSKSIWWCPRCGSLLERDPAVLTRPMLVDACRDYEKEIGYTLGDSSLWEFTIHDAIYPEDER